MRWSPFFNHFRPLRQHGGKALFGTGRHFDFREFFTIQEGIIGDVREAGGQDNTDKFFAAHESMRLYLFYIFRQNNLTQVVAKTEGAFTDDLHTGGNGIGLSFLAFEIVNQFRHLFVEQHSVHKAQVWILFGDNDLAQTPATDDVLRIDVF